MMIGLDMMRVLDEIISAGIDDGLFRADLERDRAVSLIGQQIYGVLSVRAGEPDPLPADQASDEICAFIVHGLGR
jgi:hypothetical protein